METRNYKVTFIINLHDTKRSIPELTEWLKGVIKSVGGTVTAFEDVGVRDFVRVTHKANPSGHYLAFNFSAAGDINTVLSQKLKLEREVKRIFVESVETAVKA